MEIYTIHTDGGARGNPGPAAIGVVVHGPDGQEHTRSQTIGNTTNNDAEYSAVVAAFELIETLHISTPAELHFYLDSQLVVRQLNGKYKVKNLLLYNKHIQIKSLEKKLGFPVIYHEIPRLENTHADALVNLALDAKR